jgi:predicted MPP superfamily phosphohydrolase
VRFPFFIVVATTFLVLIHVYLYRRLIRDTTRRLAIRRAGAALTVALAILFIIARMLSRHPSPQPWGMPLFSGSWLWLGLTIYLACFLAATDGLRWVAKRFSQLRPSADRADSISEERRLFLSRAAAGGAVALTGGMGGFGLWRAYEPPKVTEIALRLPNLPKALEGFSIVQLSDLHISNVIRPHFLDDVVRRCNALKPDLLAITGDLVDGSVPDLGTMVARLTGIRSRSGSFFVTGNHDYYSGDREWCDALGKMGFRVLRNERASIGDSSASFDLVGVDDWGHRESQRRPGYDLNRALRGRDPSRSAVLLAHQPENFEEAVERGMGVQLSGHTHGGQFFPVTTLVSLHWPYSAGLYTHGEGKLYVSRGTGFWGPPLRSGSPSEIVKITLLS